MKATAMLPANPTLLRASESQTAAPQQDPDDHDDDVDQACWVYSWVFTRTKWGDNTRDLRHRCTTWVGAHAGGIARGAPVKTTLAGAGFAEAAHWGVQSPPPFLGTPPSIPRIRLSPTCTFCQAQAHVLRSRPCHDRPAGGRRQRLLRTTKSPLIAQKQAGYARVQIGYVSLSDAEVSEAMRPVADQWHSAVPAASIPALVLRAGGGQLVGKPGAGES